jgi:hypothetical protein
MVEGMTIGDLQAITEPKLSMSSTCKVLNTPVL